MADSQYKAKRLHAKKPPISLHCQHCQAPIIGRLSYSVYCCKRCKVAAWRARNPERARQLSELHKPHYEPVPKRCPVYCGPCLQCAVQIAGKGKYCSVCAKARAVEYRIANAVERNSNRVCLECAKTYDRPYGYGPTGCCSHVCLERRNDKRRKAANRRRRKIYGNKYRSRAKWHGVSYEPVDVRKVFDRDGWRCQVCGKQTPAKRRGTYHANAPELDHRIAMANGGPHSYANCQCCCRACNLMKSDKITVGQFSLFS
jgi:HNH endonuclease